MFTANGGFSLPDMELNDRGELWVCKNPSPATPTDLPGLLAFSVASDALLAGPLDTGLPPIALTFDHATDEVTGVGAPLGAPSGSAIALAGPWPNPARGAARFSLSLARSSTSDVAVLDAAGRHVRTLMTGTLSAGEHPISWDLADDSGRPLPPVSTSCVRRWAGR